ncbi:hypothetical protein E4T47_00986 [Aureobasidium subglaciale]|nr:hypothetical protein E4T43_00577 [Aureobasidium subglaciale]KAI5276205.1 hypothetical protein E4T47_00986 [Aureobasidium subglaciale]
MTTLPGSSSYANGDRRKRSVVTYGRPARNPTFSANSVKNFYDESRNAASPSKLKRPTTTATRKIKDTDDEFDIPMSDEEAMPVPPKTKNPHKTPIKASQVVVTAAKLKEDDDLNSASPRKRKRTTSQLQTSSKKFPVARAGTKELPRAVVKSIAIDVSHPRRSRRQIAAGASVTSVPSSLHPGLDVEQRAPSVKFTKKSACPLSPVVASPTSPADSVSSISTTPKQTKLWHELLTSDPPDVDAYQPNIDSAQLSPNRVSVQTTVSNSHPHVAPNIHRARIVDHLKKNASNDESSDDESDEPSAGLIFKDMEDYNQSAQSVLQEPTQHPQSQGRQQTQPSSISQGTKKVTYARSRTYLQDSLEDMIFGDLPIDDTERPAASARRIKAPPTAKPKSMIDHNHESDEDNSQGIRSIHDLRAAGNKSRFLDDVTRLIDEIKSPSPSSRSQRRMALMDLSSTLTDGSFASRFIEHGFDTSIIAQFQYAGIDILADMLLCVVLTRIAQASASLLRGGVLEFLTPYLDDTKDIAQLVRERKSNMSKVAQSDYLEFMEKVRTGDVWESCSPEYLSPCSIALMSIDVIVVTHRRNKHTGAILSPSTASKLVNLATGHESELELDLQAVTNRALSALEAATTLDIESASSDVWSVETLSRVASALPKLLGGSKHSKGLALRFCCSVTNKNEDNSSVFCEPHTIDLVVSLIIEYFNSRQTQGTEAVESNHDLLVLALGLMINLTSVSQIARERTANTKDEGLATLVSIFVRGQEHAAESQSEEEMQASIPYGWLSVLLGYVCLDETARTKICDELPGKNGGVLVDAVEVMALMSQQVDSQAAEEREETTSGFTQTLLALVDRLRNGA